MLTEFNGILFIGDPHVSSKNIARRKDDYLSSVLGKLTACAALCHERNLFPLVLGDLFHKYGDNNLTMLNRLVRVFKLFPCPPMVIEGNHDKEQVHLSDSDALMLLHLTGVADVVQDSGLARTLNVAGKLVHVYAAPHGAAIPDGLPPAVQDGVNILITHHDLAFGSTYPGSIPLKSIANAMMVVNGHMHDTKPSVVVENTTWHNPGNIEPLSVDLAGHFPNAWEWTPAMGVTSLKGHPLPHGTDLFDMTGLQVEAGDADAAVAQLVEQSEFALLLKDEGVALDAGRTADASILQEDLEVVLTAAGASTAAQALLRNLVNTLAANAA